MPDLSTAPVRRYQPLDAYNHVVDNGPIEDLDQRDVIINAAVEQMRAILDDAIGSQPDLATRLAVSLNPDGSLIAQAVDDAQHSIAEHEDTDDYVRMTAAERAKLTNVSDDATSFGLRIEFPDEEITFDDGVLELVQSDTVAFRQVGAAVAMDVRFPLSSRHIHYYDVNPATTDRRNYTTNGVPTAYKMASLRVYVNGIRLSQTDTVPVPVNGVVTQLKYTEGAETGGIVTGGDFALNAAITVLDRIRIDFDFLPSA